MPEASVNGQRYAYLDEGDGPLVLFGHGLSCDRHLFDAQIEVLAERYRCVSIDWPGHGETTHRPQGWTLDDLADDTIALLEHLGGPAALVGLSQGGMVFLRVAASRPDLSSALVLLDTSAGGEPPERAAAVLDNAARIAAAPEPERREFYRDLGLPAFFSQAWLQANPEAAADELELRLSHDPAGYLLAVRSVALRRAIREEAAAVRTPTMILVGELDSLTPPDHARELQDLIPGSRLAVVPGAAHHTPIEHPQLVTELISGFLAEVLPV